MILSELKIHNVRSIELAHLHLHPRFNFIIGPNGSGKTSVLESLYLLSSGRSFRSREIDTITSFNKASLTVFGHTLDKQTISIQKSSSASTQIKLNNKFCSTTSQLAFALPCQVIHSDLFQITDAGPSVRRALIDWGLFHVKHEYFPLWKEYTHVLKQRNRLLKQSKDYAAFIPWDKMLSDLAEQLHAYRKTYFTDWMHSFNFVLKHLSDVSCTVSYFKGWDKKNAGLKLSTILSDQFNTDLQRQYTQSGAHQADLYIESNDKRVRNILSRGQQKVILIALKLAQGSLLSNDCLYLFDDITAELDSTHMYRLLSFINSHKGQYIISSNSMIPSLPLNSSDYFIFYSDDGFVKPNVSRETIEM